MIILCFVFPPLAVFLSTHNPMRAIINLGLTCLFWIPGIIHAIACASEAKHGKMIRQSERRITKSLDR